jgi:hypothetical protein
VCLGAVGSLKSLGLSHACFGAVSCLLYTNCRHLHREYKDTVKGSSQDNLCWACLSYCLFGLIFVCELPLCLVIVIDAETRYKMTVAFKRMAHAWLSKGFRKWRDKVRTRRRGQDRSRKHTTQDTRFKMNVVFKRMAHAWLSKGFRKW